MNGVMGVNGGMVGGMSNMQGMGMQGSGMGMHGGGMSVGHASGGLRPYDAPLNAAPNNVNVTSLSAIV